MSNTLRDSEKKELQMLADLTGYSMPRTWRSEDLRVVRAFASKVEAIGRSALILECADGYLAIPGRANSRYCKEGRSRIKVKLEQSVDSTVRSGVLLTLTFWRRKQVGDVIYEQSKEQAWATYGARVRELMNVINMYRKSHKRRHGRKSGVRYKSLSYIWVVEPQTGDSYPHIHVWFPGLKWLSHWEHIQRNWPEGAIKVEYKRGSAKGYVCKYISKMSGWDVVSAAYLWASSRRLYGVSRAARCARVESSGKWRLYGRTDGEAIYRYIPGGVVVSGRRRYWGIVGGCEVMWDKPSEVGEELFEFKLEGGLCGNAVN